VLARSVQLEARGGVRPLSYVLRHYFAQGERLAVSFKAEQ
jgi:hypothetical protein